MPALYESPDFCFQYPENWRLIGNAEEPASSEGITVESPQGAIWTIACHPQDVDPQSLCDAALEALQNEEDYFDFEITEVEEEVAGVSASGYDLFFSCVELIVAARIRTFHQANRIFLTLSQAEIRDHESLEPVFAAMTHSLLLSKKGERVEARGE